ncbi:MAG: regulatory protein RecX [Gemmatimonadota bacterium]
MPHLTRLRPSPRRPGRTELFLDGVFLCRIPTEAIRHRGLAKGSELAPEEVEELREAGRRCEAADRALRYAAGRPRSRFQVERHLRRAGYGEGAVRAAVERCVQAGHLDDREFAAAFARDRIRLRPRSLALLEAELRERGVDRSDARAGIARALEEEVVTEEELLRRAAAKGWRRLRSAAPEQAKRRLYGYLSRRGFRAAEVRAAVERLAGPPGGLD